MEQIEYIVLKRQNTLDYLKRTHQGRVYWLNVIRLSREDIESFYAPAELERRAEQLFILGLSVGRLLELSQGALVVRALAQLMEEYEYFVSHGMVSGALTEAHLALPF